MKFQQTYFLPLQNRINSTTFVDNSDNSRSCGILVTFWYERYLTSNKHFDVDVDLVRDPDPGFIYRDFHYCSLQDRIKCKKWAELLSIASDFDSPSIHIRKEQDWACLLSDEFSASVWKCSSLNINTKVHLYQALVTSVLLCSAETWTLLAANMNTHTLEAFHMRCQRQMLDINVKNLSV